MEEKIILIVDDEECWRKDMLEILSRFSGIWAVEAENGEEALEKLENGLVPDYIVTDMLMGAGYMKGGDFILEARKALGTKNPPIVIVSSSDMAGVVARDLGAGFVSKDIGNRPSWAEEVFQKLGLGET